MLSWLGEADDLGPDVEQPEQMAQEAGEEGHLLDPNDQHPPRGRDRRDRGLDLLAGQRAGVSSMLEQSAPSEALELGVTS